MLHYDTLTRQMLAAQPDEEFLPGTLLICHTERSEESL